MTTEEITHVSSCKGGNTIPLDDEGRPYHYGCKASEVSNQFLICSCYALAEDISKLFDKDKEVFERRSNRGYTTYTGYYHGKRISVVAFGIGFAMIDFLIREVRAITKGKLTFIQIGEAPSPSHLPVGTAVNVKDAVAFEIDYNNFEANIECPYRIFKNPAPADEAIFKQLGEALKAHGIESAEGRVASNPSFVCGLNAPTHESGGLGAFDFHVSKLQEKLEAQHGKIATYEMDTFPLYWTARREVRHEIATGAISIVSADYNGKILTDAELRDKQLKAAAVALEVLGNQQ